MKDLMNVHEAANVIGVHVETVRKWLTNGDLTGSNTPAGWRITPADIEAWLAKYRRGISQPEPSHSMEKIMSHVSPPPEDQRFLDIRVALKDWMQRNSRDWVNNLNAIENCTLDGAFRLFKYVQDRKFGTCYSVWTGWHITTQEQDQYKLGLDIYSYPRQSIPGETGRDKLHEEGYEVRIFFHGRTLPRKVLEIVKEICNGLLINHGFKDNRRFTGYAFDYFKSFHKPVTYENIIEDITPYVGPLENNGQHLEPYIRRIARAL